MFFKKPKQETDILPPPFPFPKLEIFEAEKQEKQIGKKIEKEVKKIKPEIKEKIKPFKERIFFKLPKIKGEIELKEKPSLALESLKEPIEIEKLLEAGNAEQEISRAIEDLKKQKYLFKLSKPEKEKQKIKLPEMAEKLQKLPPVEIEEPKDEVIAIKHKIHDARNALMDFDLIKAKVIYIKIMNMYNNLSPEKQARVYEDIMELYDERKNAESLRLKA